LHEFRLEKEEGTDIEAAGELKVGLFEAGQKVDVTGTTRGRGFAGVIRRYHFGGGDASHGNSLSHRAPGSIGQCQTPGRVFKGKKMAGQMGNARRTIQNLELVRVDEERHLLLVKGAIPGAPGSDVVVKPAVKASK
jgi:large subunit ribosomal protein L3